MRLERGSAAFLRDASDELVAISGRDVLSPALMGTSARMWERSGYEQAFRLNLMESLLNRDWPAVASNITVTRHPDWKSIEEIDKASFDPFWRMSPAGLREAAAAAPETAVFTVGDSAPEGYAIVGVSWSTAYLQRIAVHPASSGVGLGADLLRSAALWARSKGARLMTLNVRPGNSRAIALYEREGFSRTANSVKVLRYAA